MEIKAAVSRAVEQYKVQLNTAQSSLQLKDRKHQLAIQKLQSKIQLLKVSLASQANLPSVGTSHMQDGPGLHSKVFNFIPSTVNEQGGQHGMIVKIKFSHSIHRSGLRTGLVAWMWTLTCLLVKLQSHEPHITVCPISITHSISVKFLLSY